MPILLLIINTIDSLKVLAIKQSLRNSYLVLLYYNATVATSTQICLLLQSRTHCCSTVSICYPYFLGLLHSFFTLPSQFVPCASKISIKSI